MTKRFTEEMSKIQTAISKKMKEQIIHMKERIERSKGNLIATPYNTWDFTSISMNHPIPGDFVIYDECQNCNGVGFHHDGCGDWAETCKVCNGEKKAERPITMRDLCQEKVINFIFENCNHKELGNIMREDAEIRKIKNK